jgi:hypothetical protein
VRFEVPKNIENRAQTMGHPKAARRIVRAVRAYLNNKNKKRT